ncbi:MAG: glycosyltransferase family 2 protein [Rubricoccaceae bacterium]
MALLAAAYGLAAALLALLGAHLIALGLIAHSRRSEDAACHALPPRADALPPVLVQIPVYDEPLALVERVLEAAASLRARTVRIQLLDDSAPAAAARNGALVTALRNRGADAHHLVRGTREGFKAGALAAGLAADAAHPEGPAPFVALFDADFVPAPDFLERLLPPLLGDPSLAFAQARWTHRNAARGLCTRAQAALLDVHFAVEQHAREAAGLFVGFNGTAGVWRTHAIAEAGGWSGDTLAEDLDLSLRARLRGLRGRYLNHVSVPAELPETVRAWRRQQFRWAKGALEVGRRLGRRLWTTPGLPLRVRLLTTLHLAAPLAWPALLALIVLHPVLAAGRAHGIPLGPAEPLGALGYVAGAAAVGTHLAAQRRLGRSWLRALHTLAPALLLPPGLALAGTRAALEALRGQRTPFVRTPKRAVAETGWLPGEAMLCGYALLGGALLLSLGAIGPALVQAFFAASLGYAAWPPSPRPAGPPPVAARGGTCAAKPPSVLA